MIERILELLEAKWLIHRDTAISYLPMLLAFVNGQKFAWSPEEEIENKKRRAPKVLAFGRNVMDVAGQYSLDDPQIPANSIAVIPISGTILAWSSQTLIENIRKAQANDKIISILFPVNSPGGMAFMTDIAAQAIKNTEKPTTAMIMNMAASGAMWLISAMDYRIATSPMDFVGSIGVRTSWTDFTDLFEKKLGIKVQEIYATLSTRKNEFTRALKDGNSGPVVADLDFVNQIFHQAIRDNLGIKQDSEVFAGATYNAQQGISLGLINEVNTMDYALEYAYKRGLSNKIKTYQFTKN
jgi:protease-4